MSWSRARALDERLYVPEPFNQSRKVEAAQRRRAKLAILRPHEGLCPLAVVLGEFKACEAGAVGKRIWIRHMPDAPLLVEAPTLAAHRAPLRPAIRGARCGHRRRRSTLDGRADPRPPGADLRSRKRQPDAGQRALDTAGRCARAAAGADAGFAAATIHQTAALRRRSVAVFANVLLLDAGPAPVPLHVLSPFMKTTDRAAKERAIAKAAAADPWVWNTDQPLPPLPAVHGDAPRMVSAA